MSLPEPHPLDKDLLIRILRIHAFQPATAYWRWIEVNAVRSVDLPGGRWLDLGCGDGKLTSVLFDKIGPREATGVEIDDAEYALAAAAGVYVTVHHTGGAEIPEQSGSIDVVFSNSVLEHIDDFESVIAEVRRILKKGGRFIFTVPSASFEGLLKGAVRPWKSRHDYIDSVNRRLQHKHYLSVDDWTDRLRAHSLDVQGAVPYLTARQVRRWETWSRWTGGVAYALLGERKPPIVLQRKLGLRRAQASGGFPGWALSLLGWMLTLGSDRTPISPSEADAGCLLINGVAT